MNRVLIFILIGCVLTESSYRDRIPNGYNVPSHSAVGHTDASNGSRGNLNSFGNDFKSAGLVWTKALCEKDSDGDGRSNGLELGDPNCTWKQGDPQPTAICSEGITDPSKANTFTSTSCTSNSSTTGSTTTSNVNQMMKEMASMMKSDDNLTIYFNKITLIMVQ